MFDGLDGFTYYPDFVTSYSRTYPSVPYLLTGKECKYDLPYTDFIQNAWDTSDYIKKLRNNGANIGLYTNTMFVGEKQKDLIDNYSYFDVYDINNLDVEALIKEFTVLSAYRCSPYIIKMKVNSLYPINIGRIMPMPYNNCTYYDDIALYNKLQKNKISINPNYCNTFRFYHMCSTHGYITADIKEPTRLEERSIEDTLYGCLKIVKEYISYMKYIGIYDNSTIIITTDHGSHNKIISDDSVITSLLLIKEPNCTGNVVTDESSVCHKDLLPVLYENSILSSTLNNEIEKIRYFNLAKGEKYCEKYEITGDARDGKNWKKIDEYEIKYSPYKTE